MSGVLAIDVSNSLTTIALWDGAAVAGHWSLASDPTRTADEYAVLLHRLLTEARLDAREAGGAVLACVVPEMVGTMEAVCERILGIRPLVVGPGVRTGLRIRTENPRELGADRIANAVGAVARHGAPVVVLDFSTALTVDVVGPAGDYLGAVIAPGMAVAAEALSRRTARLGRIELNPPPRAIGATTEEGLQSGLVLGHLGLVEGLVGRVRAEIGPAPTVATGEAPWLVTFLSHSRVIDVYEPLLTLDGLRRIHERHNARSSNEPNPAGGPGQE